MSLLRRPWIEDDFRRHMELRRIFGMDRHGSVEGVEFDLRHPLIDPKEWFTHVIGAVGLTTFRSDREPFLWFPWMGNFDAEVLRSELLADEQKFEGTHNERRFNAVVRSRTPEHFVYAGDKLVVVRVEREAIGGIFEHDHDNEIRLAYLHIQRASGKVEKVKTPLTFTGNLALFAPRSGRNYFDTVLRRVLNHFGLNQLSDVPTFMQKEEPDLQSYALAALERAYCLADRTREARRLDYYGSWKTRKERDARDKVQILNEAVALGYIWAKAEDSVGMEPLAVSALRTMAGGATGGRKSGEARRLKRARTWEAHARALAKQCRSKFPAYSQDRIANEIIAGWKEADFEPPGHKTLKELISAMEKSGDLPPRKLR